MTANVDGLVGNCLLTGLPYQLIVICSHKIVIADLTDNICDVRFMQHLSIHQLSRLTWSLLYFTGNIRNVE